MHGMLESAKLFWNVISRFVLDVVNGSSDPLVSIANIIEVICLKLGGFRKVQVLHVNIKTIVLFISWLNLPRVLMVM